MPRKQLSAYISFLSVRVIFELRIRSWSALPIFELEITSYELVLANACDCELVNCVIQN